MQELVTNPITNIGKLPQFQFGHKIAYSFSRVFLSLFHVTTSSLEESVSPKDDTSLRMNSPLISA